MGAAKFFEHSFLDIFGAFMTKMIVFHQNFQKQIVCSSTSEPNIICLHSKIVACEVQKSVILMDV